jgi:hypothetical protein
MIERNITPWASGNTRLVRWNSPGFESSSGQSSIYIVLVFVSKRSVKDFYFFYRAFLTS